MKARFGGVLAIALGTVLIVNGVNASGDGSVGVLPVQCGAGQVGISQSTGCPVGGITITDTSPAAPGLPADYDVVITSTNCLNPDGQAVNRTLTVPIGGSATTDTSQLFVYTSVGSAEDGPKCEYTLTREADPAFTATFTPASPVTIPFSNNDRSNDQRVAQVNLVNAAPVATSTPPSAEPSVTLEPSGSVEPTGSGPTTDFTDPAVSDSAGAGDAGASTSADPIAETGPSQPITASLWLGIGLLFLGLFLLFEGRIRTLGRHRD